MDAWNKHDANAFASLFAKDADFKDSHQTTENIKVPLIKPDVASVNIWWNMTGASDDSGQPRPPRRGILNWIMTNEEGKWLVKVMHNLDLTAITPIK
ncbi:hypothetical protein E6H31_06080 [Candidatus Bathyarchaeota archaeon]|nr:MAG: hypothetical protein E6H31_06080 [Candidatus Bathyarchaeota archaeon]